MSACLKSAKHKAQQSRQLQHTEDSELSAVDLLFSLNAYLNPDADYSQGSRVFLLELPAICTGVPLRPANKSNASRALTQK